MDPRTARLKALAAAALAAPPGAARKITALCAGLLCHGLFAAAIASMAYGMYWGLTQGAGSLPWPWALAANLALVLQFPLMHSLLLTRPGLDRLTRLIPGPHGRTLSTTGYTVIASAQLLALFWLWTPSGIVWWRAEGLSHVVLLCAYGLSWAMLAKAIFDAGAELQSGALGWLSLLADRAPTFPDLPTLGLFRIIRQPIYLAFACTLWTVPTWTPDQLMLAVLWTLYCVAAPRLKERRLEQQHGERFERYRRQVPYMIPRRHKDPPPHAHASK